MNKFKTSSWLTEETQTGITTQYKSGSEGNGGERVLHMPQNSRTGTLQSDAV